MRRFSVHVAALAALVGVLALAAATVGAGSAPAKPATPTKAAGPTGAVDVQFAINRFERQGKRIVARGAVIGKYVTEGASPYVIRQAFTARVNSRLLRKSAGARSPAAASRICDVLTLDLRRLHLELLGLVVDLDRVLLTIKADSNGGLLGSLLCGLAGGGAAATTAKLNSTAKKMTKAAQQGGLNKGVAGFHVNVQQGFSQTAVCPILDLVLGPLDLNLLGLMVHLNQVHLTITAVRGGGILGDLLCGLAGGPPPPGVAYPRVGALTG